MQPFTQNLAQYLPDAAVLAAVFLLLLPRWRRQGRRRLAVSALFYLYMAGVLWVTVLPVLSMIGVHHPYQPMVLEPFRDLRLGYGNALRQLLLNALMTVPLGFLWPLVRRRSDLLRAVGARVPAQSVHRTGAASAPHRPHRRHHRPDLQHRGRTGGIRAVPAVEACAARLDVKR